ncbi:hypothetical protein MRX96_000783 [Rhipicephalus microplus]
MLALSGSVRIVASYAFLNPRNKIKVVRNPLASAKAGLASDGQCTPSTNTEALDGNHGDGDVLANDDCRRDGADEDLEEPVSEVAVSEAKYLVFDSCLMALFERCRSRQAACRVQKETDESLLRITATCLLQHVWSWESQPMLKRKAMGNILLAGAILFSGSNPKRVLRLR